MKTILVIDIDDGVKLDELEIRYVIQDKFGTPVKAEVDGVKLKPLPQEKDDLRYLDSYAKGYNDCIDEILGDENE